MAIRFNCWQHKAFLVACGTGILLAGQGNVVAQNIVQPSATEQLNDCPHLPERNLWPLQSQAEPALRSRTSEDSKVDRSDASSFEAWRELGKARKVRLAVCVGSVNFYHTATPGQVHLIIRLPRELPKGSTVGQFVQQLQVSNDEADIFIKVPEQYHAAVTVELPDGLDMEADLGEGTMQIFSFQGNITTHIGRGQLMLPPDIDDRYKWIRASFGAGNVRDETNRRDGHLHNAFTWKHSGKGARVLTATFGTGFLDVQSNIGYR